MDRALWFHLKSISYEISEYIPKSLIEIKITSSKKAAKGVWIYKLSIYQIEGFYKLSDLQLFLVKLIDLIDDGLIQNITK